MSTTLEELIVSLGLDTDAYDKGISGAADKSDSFVSKITGGLGGIALGATVGAIAGVGGALYSAISSASDAQAQFAQTEAVIKSTGGASGKTADELADLASQLSSASGASRFGDDAILGAENLLATFTEIKGPIFDQATKAMVDMGTAMHTGPEASAIQLGKALNDPVAGVSALSRVGVTFTDQQKSVIESMVKTGNVAGAQSIILAELNKEFGGSGANSAATFAGKLDTLKDKFGELLESAGGKFLPVLSTVLDTMNSEAVQGAIAGLVDGLFNGIAAIAPLVASGLQLITGAITPVIQAWFDASDATSSFSETLGYFLDTVLGGLSEDSDVGFFQNLALNITTLEPLVSNLTDQIVTRFAAVMGVFTSLSGVVVGVFTILANSFANNGDLIDNLITAYEEAQQFITNAIVGIGAIITAVLGQVQKFIDAHGAEISAQLNTAWVQISDIVVTSIAILNKTIIPALGAIANFITAHSAEIQQVLTLAWGVIYGVISTTLNLISGLLHTILAAINGEWSTAWQLLKSTSEGFVTGIYGIVVNFANMLLAVFGTNLDNLHQLWVNAWNSITSFVQGIPATLADVGSAIVDAIWEGLKGRWDSFIEDVKAKLAALRDMLPFSEPHDHSSPLYGLGKSGAAIVEMLQSGIDGAGMLQAPSLDMSSAYSNQPLLNASRAASKMSNGDVIVPIDARGADRGVSAQIKDALKQAFDNQGFETQIRQRLGAA
jgi:hypothetical protein